MSQHPRFGGDGKLRLPDEIELYGRRSLRGFISNRTIDPFDWTADRLLLAESFARLELEDRLAVRTWWLRHGAVDHALFHESRLEGLPEELLPKDYLDEDLWSVATEQANVSWHLATLERLSNNRATKRWEPAWGEFVLAGPVGTFLMGGAHAGTEVWPEDTDLARRAARLPEIQRRSEVTVSKRGWNGYWGHTTGETETIELDAERIGALGSSWETAIELELLLIEPYVARTVDRTVHIEIHRREQDGRDILMPREVWEWRSVLAPIYLQLLESLRRISEGEPGAATCRECGHPFLVLDARRRFFCNDRERFRFSQRERRKRLATTAADEVGAEA